MKTIEETHDEVTELRQMINDIENRIETVEDGITETENRDGFAEDTTVFTVSDNGATYQQR